jgi:hypothetical protein
MNIKHKTEYNKKGYITLISVLVVGAVGASVATSLVLLGINASRAGLTLQQSIQVRVLAHTCAEEALQEIRNSTPYAGSGNLTLGQGDCSYTVVNNGEQSRTITATANVENVTRKVLVIIDTINPQINIVTWQEVVDF